MPANLAEPSRLPLAGTRILDLTRVLAGPYCTMILADLGAEVVKIERPGTGDDARLYGPFLADGTSAYFASINRGKKSVTLDLKQPSDRETFLKLVARTDVLVENFRPGTMEGLGLAADYLRELNPRLIYASASGFGRGNGRSNRPAYDIIIQAMSGLMSITGHDAAQPARVGTSISDVLTGMFTAIGILAALQGRHATGQGNDIDVAMLDSTVAVLENAIARFEVTGENPEPLGTRHPSIAPFQAFRAADGALVIAAGNEALWRKLCEVLEAPHLADDPLLATNPLRSANVVHLEMSINTCLARGTAAEWLARLEAAGVPAAPIRTISDVAADPLLEQRGMLHPMRVDGEQGFVAAGSPMRFFGAALPLSDHAPRVGEHNEQVLRDWLES